MLRGRGNSSRGARGVTTSSRGASSSRGRGRGASGSSSKLSSLAQHFAGRKEAQYERNKWLLDHVPTAPSGFAMYSRDLLENSGRSHFKILGAASNKTSPDPFEKERLENAAQREQRGQDGSAFDSRGGRGISRGRYVNKSVRFASPPIQQPKQFGMSESSPSDISPFWTPSTTGPNSQAPFNPFGQPSNPFGTSTSVAGKNAGSNPFGSPTPASNPFGPSSTNAAANSTGPNPFGNPKPVSNLFGSSSIGVVANNIGSHPFGNSAPVNPSPPNPVGNAKSMSGAQPSSIFGAPLGVSSSLANHIPFGSTAASSQKTSVFGAASSGFPSTSTATTPFQSSSQPNILNTRKETIGAKGSWTGSINSAFSSIGTAKQLGKSKWAIEIDDLLRRNGIIPPPWPTSPGNPSQKGAVEAFWQSSKAYRAKVRACLIRNGYLDDPDKPKRLSEAIDFKGTCEGMCPEFEKATRIVEHDVQGAEKELSPDTHTYVPSLKKMVKALARSAAGQDAPLPEDVRSPSALRRTLDYLIDTVLGDNDLTVAHGFLWDRTRAIRRDFVFQQSSMTPEELGDQIYCLEVITRFHVTALHQMSRKDIIMEDFSEQQEVEQLGKALLSLIHAYEDSVAQEIYCENEPEFRAYYVLFNSHNTGILEAVQDWGYKYWGKSEHIQTAVNLVETLQNIWDTHGPLRPHLATDIAQNAYYRFFSIVEDARVSYTMACFAEIHFNKVRKAALKSILAGYRKQRDQTRDWSLEKLNVYLRFDEEDEIIAFGEAYGLNFEIFEDQSYLSFDSEDSMIDPFPQLKQTHSYNIVERKRGHYGLPDVIHRTIYDEPLDLRDDEDFFVPPSPETRSPNQSVHIQSPIPDPTVGPALESNYFPLSKTRTPSTEKGSGNISSTISTTQTQAPIISFGHQTADPANYGDPPPAFKSYEAEVVKPGNPISTPSISMFDKKESAPQSGIFSFLNKENLTPANGISSPKSSFFPSIPSAPTSRRPDSASSVVSPLSQPPVVNGSPSSFQLNQPMAVPEPTEAQSTLGSSNLKQVPKTLGVQDAGKTEVSTRSNSIPKKIGVLDNIQSNLISSPSAIPSGPTESKMPAFATWIVTGKEGVIDQFTEFTVEQIVMQTITKYIDDEKKHHQEEEDRISREEAARFRYRYLATKYCHIWRELAHRLWMRRKGRSAREVRRQMAEQSLRASKTAEKKDVIKDFKASTESSKRHTLEQMLAATGILNAVHNPENEIRSLAKASGKRTHEAGQSTPKRSRTTNHLTNGRSPTSSNGSPEQSNDALRRSLLSDSAYLQGGSRIHLMPDYSPKATRRRQPNGVKTDYFRLKARGIMTLPNGTPLANTAAVHLVTHKQPISKPIAESALTKAVTKGVVSQSSDIQLDEDLEALKAKARLIMSQNEQSSDESKKRLFDDEEEKLFAKAKRVREQMDEDAEWFRSETQKSFSRSAS